MLFAARNAHVIKLQDRVSFVILRSEIMLFLSEFPDRKQTLFWVKNYSPSPEYPVPLYGGANAPKLEERRLVGFNEFRFDTPQLAAGSFIVIE